MIAATAAKTGRRTERSESIMPRVEPPDELRAGRRTAGP
jgi:hypothetical protein